MCQTKVLPPWVSFTCFNDMTTSCILSHIVDNFSFFFVDFSSFMEKFKSAPKIAPGLQCFVASHKNIALNIVFVLKTFTQTSLSQLSSQLQT
jgi:hypothetical protein